MSPRALPSLPPVPHAGRRLGFDAVRSATLSRLVSPPLRERTQASRPVLAARERFVADDAAAALEAARRLTRTRRSVALHPLLPPARADVDAAVATYAEAVDLLASAGLDGEVYVGPEQLGVVAGADAGVAERALAGLAAHADAAGVDLVLRTGEVEHADRVLALAATVRHRHPTLAVSLVARRHRAEADCARLAAEGARVRLVRGGPREHPSVSWSDRHEADLAFVRCLAVLLAGPADVVVATHDPALLDLTDALADQAGRGPRGVEYQMYLGAQTDLQVRTADAGHRVRVLVPYGPEWLEYLRDLVERPATARRLAGVLVGG